MRIETTTNRIIDLITIKPYNFSNSTKYFVTLPSG